MALPRNQKLREKASLAMRAGDHSTALRIYLDLERIEPEDPTWPERCAGAYHELGQTRDELTSLRRSLELLIDQGRVLPAIATCKLILDVSPEDPATLDCLHLLYTEPGIDLHATEIESRGASVSASMPEDHDAPFEELELTDVIADARPVRLGAGAGGGVSEIPLERRYDDSAALHDLDVDFVDEVRAIGRPPERKSRPKAVSAIDRHPSADREERLRLARAELSRTPLFGSLDVTTLHRLVAQVSVVRLAAGEDLFHEGDRADTLYVIVEGAVVPIAEGPPRKRLAVLEQGEFFGEIGLVTNQPRTATIEALVETRLLAIDRKVMWSLISEQSEVSIILLRFLRERLIDRTVRTHPFFQAFARAEIGSVARQFRFLEVQDGTSILEQGLPSQGLFVLLAGSLDIVDEDAEKTLGRLEPGDVFGGIALVQGDDAAASVFAVGKCWVLVLEPSRLGRILAGRPQLEDQLIEHVAVDGADAPIV